MISVAFLGALLAAFLAGAGLLVVSVSLNDERVWWPVLLGTNARTMPKSDRLAIIQRLALIEDPWRDPILLCAREQETDEEILSAIHGALAKAT